ncbi:MAG: bifunctional oligoribonuclease/PAP phosphatase NrnA [Puniceicoccales bacterium]|jgi:phosphoesterase RecJ-like protein|nr:bifunctional oligoribonuclease/PAP phosphatase NrnA [Puniceicoccales bacterium]
MHTTYAPIQSPLFRQLLDSLRGKRVAILGHLRPDGDCIGSQVALCRIFNTNGVDAICINGDAAPRNLTSLIGDTPFLKVDPKGSDYSPDGREAVFVDCSESTRAGHELTAKFETLAANIDHHLSNPSYAKVNIVDSDAPATCAMLATFALDNALPIDAPTAQALYTGIVTDTGQFRYPATTTQTLEIAAQLLRHGASIRTTTSELYERNRFARLTLLRHFLSSLTLHANGRVCTGELPSGIYEQTQTTHEDAEDLVDYARCIDGVAIAVLLEDGPRGVKGSLRAKDKRYRMDLLAQKLNGGGHALAAGFTYHLGTTLAQNRQDILAIITRHLTEIDHTHEG